MIIATPLTNHYFPQTFLANYVFAELVEEWGCYDSEFKLTCNDIDSKVGILEATFTPHCEKNGNQKCLYYDEDR